MNQTSICLCLNGNRLNVNRLNFLLVLAKKIQGDLSNATLQE